MYKLRLSNLTRAKELEGMDKIKIDWRLFHLSKQQKQLAND